MDLIDDDGEYELFYRRGEKSEFQLIGVVGVKGGAKV